LQRDRERRVEANLHQRKAHKQIESSVQRTTQVVTTYIKQLTTINNNQTHNRMKTKKEKVTIFVKSNSDGSGKFLVYSDGSNRAKFVSQNYFKKWHAKRGAIAFAKRNEMKATIVEK
jgi:hypothetical protein